MIRPSCVRCGSPDVGEPQHGLSFCQNHDLQRELWAWGARHGWCELWSERYAIPATRAFWQQWIVLLHDEALGELVCYAMAHDDDDEKGEAIA